VLVLRDTPSKTWDTQVSTFLLKQAVKGGGGRGSGGRNESTQSSAMNTQRMDPTQHPENIGSNNHNSNHSSNNTATTTTAGSVSHWNIKKLRQYIAYVKHSIHPAMGAEARTLLVRVVIFRFCIVLKERICE